MSQGMHMCNMKALSILVRKLWPRLKFCSRTHADARAMTLAPRTFVRLAKNYCIKGKFCPHFILTPDLREIQNFAFIQYTCSHLIIREPGRMSGELRSQPWCRRCDVDLEV